MDTTSGARGELCFDLLGPLRVRRDGEVLDLGRRQGRLLLARLLVDVGRTVPVDRLVDDLWGDAPPSGATGNLHALVSRLRRVLEPDRTAGMTVLRRRDPGYVLEIDPTAVDAHRFEVLAARGREHLAAGRPTDAITDLDAALALWRGDVLADIADEPFVVPVRARLDALLADAREQRAAALLASGRAIEAIATTGPVATELARLLAMRGEHAVAVAMLERCVHRCAEAGWPLWRQRAERELAAVQARRSGSALQQ